FFALLNAYAAEPSGKIPADLDALLKSKEAFSAAFLSVGWMNAALNLYTPTIVTEDLPSWVSYGYAQALHLIKGNLVTLEFILSQKRTPMLTLLSGELFLEENQINEGLEQLNKLAQDDSEAGKRAALLISETYIDQNDYKKAKKIINSQPLLAEDM